MTRDQHLIQRLIQHEDLKLKPYLDTKGKLTIGVGRNLTDVGISEDEALMLLDADIGRARADADTFGWFEFLSSPRQDVIVELIFNMGLGVFQEFRQMISALSRGDYHIASAEMLSSKWASEVGIRSVELARVMLSGDDP